MVSLLTLDMMGNALFIFQRPSYFDLQEELLTGDTKVVDATPDIPPERILMDCGTEGILAGKMVIYPDDDLQDTSRYIPLPSLSMAKECEDYIKEFCHQESDLEAYGLTFTDDFEHDFLTLKGDSPMKEKRAILLKRMDIWTKKLTHLRLAVAAGNTDWPLPKNGAISMGFSMKTPTVPKRNESAFNHN